MPLQDNGLTLAIERDAELLELQAIPPGVNKIVIKELALPSAHLARLPAHVKTLLLDGVIIRGTLVLAEGLETLEFQLGPTVTMPMKNWIFPASLKLLIVDAYSWDNVDFQSVTAPAIILNGLVDSQVSPNLPEGLDELTVNGSLADSVIDNITFSEADYSDRLRDRLYRSQDENKYFSEEGSDSEDGGYSEEESSEHTMLVKLPPYLRRLNLIGLDVVGSMSTPETRAVKELYAQRVNENQNLIQLFPALEKIHFKGVGSRAFPSLAFKQLKELILEECGSVFPATIDALALESLTILNGRMGTSLNLVLSSETTMLGQSLVRMNLTQVNRFPVAEQWDHLASVTVSKSDIELPYPLAGRADH